MNNSTPTGDDLSLSVQMQQMMAEIAQLRGELSDLKSRPNPLPQPQPSLPVNQPKATSRRKALGRLGGGLVAAGLGTSLSLIPAVAATQESSQSGKALPEGPSNITLNAVGDGSLTQTIAGLVFMPSSGTNNYAGEVSDHPGSLYYISGGNSRFFYRLDLPQNAKITSVTFFYDNSTTNNQNFFLNAYNPAARTKTSLLPSPGYLTNPSGNSITGTPSAGTNVVDNTTYCYDLEVLFNNSGYFYGASITYNNIVGRFMAQ